MYSSTVYLKKYLNFVAIGQFLWELDLRKLRKRQKTVRQSKISFLDSYEIETGLRICTENMNHWNETFCNRKYLNCSIG